MNRDDFPAALKNKLRMRAALICSNPDCRKQTATPSNSDSDAFVCLGKAAHITAASEGGPRYDASLTTEDRRAISNAIYLCSSCADLIDKNGGCDFAATLLREWQVQHESWVRENLNCNPGGIGGEGGSGAIFGDRGKVIGGCGGSGGVSGIGGKGGSGFVWGNDGVVIGGDGGNCGTDDGRGGRRAEGPAERLGFTTDLWGFGSGGSGTNHPEFNRRVCLLTSICAEYRTKFLDDAIYIEAGVDQIPADWVNQRLVELAELWQILVGKHGYQLPPLA